MLALMMLGLCGGGDVGAYMSRLSPETAIARDAAAAGRVAQQAAIAAAGAAPASFGQPAADDGALHSLAVPRAAALGLDDDEFAALTRLPRFTLTSAIQDAADAFQSMTSLETTSSDPEPAAPPIVAVEREIRRAEDGLFYVDALVNGAPVRFLVDTGATVVVLTPGDAARAGYPAQLVSFDASAETAAGHASMARVMLDEVVVADTSVNLIEAAVVRQDLAVSLLGQSWLSKLGSITIAGDRMLIN